MVVHRTKKLLIRFTSVGSHLIIFPQAKKVDPDQAALDLNEMFVIRARTH